MQEELRAVAAARGLAGDCTFVPATGQVAEWLRAIDIFVLPSRSEALSNALLEAMACGCCPVASRVGGNVELIRHGENGMLFEAGDVEQLSGVLDTLVELRVLREQLAARARSTAEQFSIRASAARMEEIYTELIEAREKVSDTARPIAVRFETTNIARSVLGHWPRDARQSGFLSSRRTQASHGTVIVGREEQAVHFIFDHVGNPASIAGYNGQARGEALQQRERHVVGIRAHEVNVRGIVKGRHSVR